MPLRETACLPPKAALFVNVSVPLKEPAEGGVAVTVTVQDPPAGTAWLQLLDSTAKFADAVRLVAANGPVPLFVNVTVCGGLGTPICELPKLTIEGTAEAIGSVNPTPRRGIITVPCGSLLTILRVVLRLPPALGVKMIW